MDVDIDVAPPITRQELKALRAALERTHAPASGSDSHSSRWSQAGILEAVGDDEANGGYALSPRKTRGATRA